MRGFVYAYLSEIVCLTLMIQQGIGIYVAKILIDLFSLALILKSF
jgi:hypothetical protein